MLGRQQADGQDEAMQASVNNGGLMRCLGRHVNVKLENVCDLLNDSGTYLLAITILEHQLARLAEVDLAGDLRRRWRTRTTKTDL